MLKNISLIFFLGEMETFQRLTRTISGIFETRHSSPQIDERIFTLLTNFRTNEVYKKATVAAILNSPDELLKAKIISIVSAPAEQARGSTSNGIPFQNSHF